MFELPIIIDLFRMLSGKGHKVVFSVQNGKEWKDYPVTFLTFEHPELLEATYIDYGKTGSRPKAFGTLVTVLLAKPEMWELQPINISTWKLTTAEGYDEAT